ncbi:S-layer homology domain-containing protein [Paenibacillus qinlingensis]|uniref:S-layer homology domain-containing protein n=1 Tax=Paenibacillus qinlingensis TaxID=1837343 RepID=UPI0015677DDB|nr:S-layer homology domain-containing protein [Paenibacillus qinlingensis]NQX62649.1 S-layer homology domain-containing protein [Paenibacillus qinlingensis]
MKITVIKKKLSAVMVSVMMFSLFASVDLAFADAITPSNSTTTATTPAVTTMDTASKFKALKDKGIFDGSDESGSAELDKEVTRAQLAKISVLLNGLKEDVPSSAIYTDLAEASWAAGYIGAATNAGYMQGVEKDHFDPAGLVTIEQAASVLARVFKLEADETDTAKVKGIVSDWAKENVASAIKLGLLADMADFTKTVNRELLVNAAYAAYQLIQAGGPVVSKVSVADFKATGAKTLVVKLNGSLADTSKLTVSILRGSITGSVVTGAQKWNTNKSEVTITLDTKMTEGLYTVKVEAVKDGGLTVDKGTAEVSVGNEKITQIDFTTPSDKIAQGKVKLTFKAVNQYKEVSDLSAAVFTINTSLDGDAIPAGDSQSVMLDVTHAVYSNKLRQDSQVFVTIMAPDYSVTANKTFTVGELQAVSKVELSDVVYVSGKTKFEAGDLVSVPYKAYDQYGYPVTDLDILTNSTLTSSTATGVIDMSATSPARGFDFIADETGDGIPELKIKAASNFTNFSIQDVMLTLTGLGSGQSVSKVMKVAASKAPYEFSIGNFPNTVAVGDEDFYLPLVVKDQGGTILTTDEVVENADKISVFGLSNGSISVGAKDSLGRLIGGIEKSGANRGTIRVSDLKTLSDVNKGPLTIKAALLTSEKTAVNSTNIVAKRFPKTVYFSVVPKPKMLPSLEMVNGRTENAFRLKFKDQYNEDFDRDYRGYSMKLSFAKTSGTVTDAVYVLRGSTTAFLDTTKTSFIVRGVDGTVEGYDSGKVSTDFGYYRDRDFFFIAKVGDNNEGTYQVTAQLFKGDEAAVAAGSASLMSTAIGTTQLLKGREANNLLYTLTPFANGIYAVDKVKDTLQGSLTNVINNVYSTEGVSLENMFSGKVVLTAKDVNGNIVQLPNNTIQQLKSVTTSNTRASSIVNKPRADGAVANAFDGYGIRGKDVGTTSISVLFKPSNYTGNKVAFLDNIAIKDDSLVVSSLTATYNGKARIMGLSQLKAGVNIFTGNTIDTVAKKLLLKQTFSNITLMDQYGNNAFRNSSVIRVAPIFGIQIFISNVKWTNDNIVPDSGYLAVESNITGVNNVNGLSNQPYPLAGNETAGYTYPSTDADIGATAGGKVDPTDWVFSTINSKIRLYRGDAKYIYKPATSAIDGTSVEVASFTATMITANGKSISVDVYPDPLK